MTRHLILVVLAVAYAPRASAQQKGPVEQIQEWIQNFGKPPPPAKPPEPPAQNTVTLNPLALEHDQLGIEYERALWKGASLYLGPQGVYGSAGPNWLLSVGLNVGMRFFVMGDAPSGLYIGPEVDLAYERVMQDGVLSKAFGVGFGGGAGLSVVFLNRFALSVGFSAQYRTEPDAANPGGNVVTTRFRAIPRLAFGVAF